MRVSEIRGMSLTEAKRQVAELRAELAKDKAVAASGTRPENPGKIRAMRRNIARFLTLINEKIRAGEKETSEAKTGKKPEKEKPEAKTGKKEKAQKKGAKKSKKKPAKKKKAKKTKKKGSDKKTKKKKEVKKR